MRTAGYAAMVMVLLGAASSVLGAIGYSDVDAYWQLNGDLMDSAGADNGTFVDQDGGGVGVVYATGFDGTTDGALDFAGTSDHVDTPYVVDTGAKTISFFFTSRANTYAQLMVAANSGNDRFYFGAHHPSAYGGSLAPALGDGAVFIRPDNDFTPTGTPINPNNTWHHYVVTDDGAGNGTVYYRSPSDAQHLVYTWAYVVPAGGSGGLTIGAFAGGGWATSGLVDDVAVFNRVLTQTEAASIYTAGSVRALLSGLDSTFATNELHAYWKLDGDLTDAAGSSDGSFVDHDGGGISVAYVTGFNGVSSGALDFGGTGNKDNMETAFITPAGAKSISLFFTSGANSPSQFLAGEGSDQRFYFGIHHTSLGQGSLLAALGVTTTVKWPSVHFDTTGTDVSHANKWHHYVVTDDGAGNAAMYSRSSADTWHAVYSFSYSGTTGGLLPFAIGGFHGSGGWALDGIVDDVAVFNRELTLAEIETIYYTGSVAPLLTAPPPPTGTAIILR